MLITLTYLLDPAPVTIVPGVAMDFVRMIFGPTLRSRPMRLNKP